MESKSHMFWSPNLAYKDGIPIPRVTYQCPGYASKGEGLTQTHHTCKKVVDHPGPCMCICDREFGE